MSNFNVFFCFEGSSCLHKSLKICAPPLCPVFPSGLLALLPSHTRVDLPAQATRARRRSSATIAGYQRARVRPVAEYKPPRECSRRLFQLDAEKSLRMAKIFKAGKVVVVSLKCRISASFSTRQSKIHPDLTYRWLAIGFFSPIKVLSGRYAGRKAVVIKQSDEGTKDRPYAHAIVAGVDRYPRKVTKRMGAKKVAKRSKVKPFVKVRASVTQEPVGVGRRWRLVIPSQKI